MLAINFLMIPGVLLLTPVVLTCHGVLDINAPSDTMCANISFISGVRSVGGANLVATIPGLIVRGKIGVVQQLNMFCSKITFLM